jgi:hypothetical protein
VLRFAGATILSIVLALFSSNAFRQAVGELRDTEPGSLLFGVLQLVIGTSTAMAAVGVFTRSKWTARLIGMGGAAVVALLLSQPLFEPMDGDAKRGIWLGAAVAGAAAAGMAWLARRLATTAGSAGIQSAQAAPAPPALLTDAQSVAGPIGASTRHAHDAPLVRTPRQDDPSRTSGRPQQE